MSKQILNPNIYVVVPSETAPTDAQSDFIWTNARIGSDIFIPDCDIDNSEIFSFDRSTCNFPMYEETKRKVSYAFGILSGVNVENDLFGSTLDTGIAPGSILSVNEDKWPEWIPGVSVAASLTYSELREKMNGGTLSPGAFYRITDYVTTVNTNLTNVRSAGHSFNIIVQATSRYEVNHNAFVDWDSQSNSYFSDCDLSAWRIKYTPENLDNTYLWADLNGKGVIYYMKDEYGNECPYDFKNIQYKVNYDMGGYSFTSNESAYNSSSLEEAKWLYTFNLIEPINYSTLSYSSNSEISISVSGYSDKVRNIQLQKRYEGNTGPSGSQYYSLYNGLLLIDPTVCSYAMYNIRIGSTNNYYATSCCCGNNIVSPYYFNMSETLTYELPNIVFAVRGQQLYSYAYNNYGFESTCALNDNKLGKDCQDIFICASKITNNTFNSECSDIWLEYNSRTYEGTISDNKFGSLTHDICLMANNKSSVGSVGAASLRNYFVDNIFDMYCGNFNIAYDSSGNRKGSDCPLTCIDNTFGYKSAQFKFFKTSSLIGNKFGSYVHDISTNNVCRTMENCIFDTSTNNITCTRSSNVHFISQVDASSSTSTTNIYCSSISFSDQVVSANNLNFYGVTSAYIIRPASGLRDVSAFNADFYQGVNSTNIPIDNGYQYKVYGAYRSDNNVRDPYVPADIYGIPADGSTGNVLVKLSDSSYDVGWTTIDVDTELMVNTTYSELIALRDSSSLVPGMQYRITDYACTTTQVDTSSANHTFDIIVTADNGRTLNENAKAALHVGDSYFLYCNLNSWELKYSLDNDTSRFAWADVTNGKGVIYYMKDEWNNECSYDFKNILFKRWAITMDQDHPSLVVDSQDNNYGFYYGAKSLFGNNVLSSATYGNDFGWFYTFALKDLATGDWYDYTVITHMGLLTDEGNEIACYDNHIEAATDEYSSGTGEMAKMLNNIVFFNCYTDLSDTSYAEDYSYCNNNRFQGNCYSNTFGNNCGGNMLGNYCYSNTFGNGCGSNTLGNGCNSNMFGNEYNYNMFGNSCSNNTFGNNCGGNMFGNNCNGNTFGYYCNSNTFGNNCDGNTLGNCCQRLTVFNSVKYCSVTGGSNGSYVKNAQILNGTAGTSSGNKLTINFEANKSYTQIAGKNTSDTLKIWNPADLIQ